MSRNPINYNQPVELRDTLDPTNDGVRAYPDDYNSTRITTATTTTIKTGAGRLARVLVDGGTLGAITIYDNTAGSGTIIASYTPTTSVDRDKQFFCKFNTGLTIVTAAATQVVVTWR